MADRFGKGLKLREPRVTRPYQRLAAIAARIATVLVLVGVVGPARADDGWIGLGIEMFWFPGLLGFFLLLKLAVPSVPRGYRSIVVAVGAAVVAPVSNGTFYWPLFVYLAGLTSLKGEGQFLEAALMVAITATIAWVTAFAYFRQSIRD